MEQFEYNKSNLYLKNHRTCTNYLQHGLFWLRPNRHIYPNPHLFIYAFVFIPKQSWSDLSGWQLWITLMQRDTENIWSWSVSTCTTRLVALDFSDLSGLVCDVALACDWFRRCSPLGNVLSGPGDGDGVFSRCVWIVFICVNTIWDVLLFHRLL